jgi:hypothetical protein
MGAKLKSVTVKLPWVEGELVADEGQQRAAWEMYVELVTRIAVQPLGPDEGMLREALASLYALFGETRRILREYGPDVAIPQKKKLLSFGQLAVDVLNHGLRPFLARWHPLLLAWESTRTPAVSVRDHERAWPRESELRSALEDTRRQLQAYADILAEICGVPPLHGSLQPKSDD